MLRGIGKLWEVTGDGHLVFGVHWRWLQGRKTLVPQILQRRNYREFRIRVRAARDYIALRQDRKSTSPSVRIGGCR